MTLQLVFAIKRLLAASEGFERAREGGTVWRMD